MSNVVANPRNLTGFRRNKAPAKLTRAGIRRFEAFIGKKYEGVVFELTATRGLLMGNVIELARIIVPARKQGTGTAIMREFCEFADRHAVEIRLMPASKGDYAATTSRGRLIRFYKRFDFVEERARPGEFRPVPMMIRQRRV